MFSKEDFSHIPTEDEMSNYINNELWNKFCKFINIIDKLKTIL